MRNPLFRTPSMPIALAAAIVILALLLATSTIGLLGQATRQPPPADVVSRYIVAIQQSDVKTIVDLTLSYQQELQQIKEQNPQALWPKLIDDYYKQKMGALSQKPNF